jgi:hypothetical protein
MKTPSLKLPKMRKAEKKASLKGSFLERAKDLCGIAPASFPKELSTNKKYMEGYGQ